MYAIIGFNREKMECDEDDNELNYCRYSYPTQLLKDIGIQDCAKNNSTTNLNCDDFMYENQKKDFSMAIVALVIFIIFFRAVAFCIMRYRLKH